MSRRDERTLNRAITFRHRRVQQPSDEDSNDYGRIANRRPPIPSLRHHWPAGYQSFVAGYIQKQAGSSDAWLALSALGAFKRLGGF
jgi:hypothetical protein